MSHARYVGRVGALAVTLGVGWAVATAAPGVAFADDTASGTGDTSATTDAGPSATSARSERRARVEQRR